MPAVDRSALSEFIHTTKYARYMPEVKRRELPAETIARVETMHLERFPQIADDIKWAFDMVRQDKVLPSMRSMQFGGAAVLQNNARLFNCSYSLCDRPRFFQEALFLLLSGAGVGFSVQYEHVEKLPALKRVDTNIVKHHIIADTIEGWADALGALITGYLRGYHVEFSYHKIRDRGEILKTSGGRAPGHLPLRKALEKIRLVLDGAQNRQLRPVECYRIMCLAADAVLSGGIRRSAMICLFSYDDDEMMAAKTGDWYVRYPEYANSNNSVVLVRKDAKKRQFQKIIKAAREWGEPGFFFTDEIDIGTNPCFSPDTRIATADGMRRVVDLFENGQKNKVVSDARVGKGNAFSPSRFGVLAEEATPVFKTGSGRVLYEVETEHGYTVRATGNHDFVTLDGRKRLEDLVEGDLLPLQSDEGLWAKEAGREDHLSTGFLYGMVAGDGCVSGHSAFVDVWEKDFESVPYLVETVVKVTGNKDAHFTDCTLSVGGVQKKRLGGVGFRKWLDSSLNENSIILKEAVPEAVWCGSRDLARGYLQGLFFTDGTVNVVGSKKKQTVSLRLGQSDKKFLQDVQALLANFGVVSRLYLRRPVRETLLPDGRGGSKLYPCKDYWELIVNRPNSIRFIERIGVDLLGWKGRLLQNSLEVRGFDCRKPERYVTKVKSVKMVGLSDTYCLTQPATNCVIAGGVVVGQCAEIALNPVLTIDADSFSVLTKMWEEDSSKMPAKAIKEGETYTGWAMCNLSEQNAALFKTKEDFFAAAKAAAIIGTVQASYSSFPYLGWVTEAIVKREALLGVGMTGIMDSPAIALNPEYQREAAKVVIDTNREIAAKIGVRQAARTTCVKPSGTTSLRLGCVASGIHGHPGSTKLGQTKYFRRVVANMTEPTFRHFLKTNPHMCESKGNDRGDWVITFPVEVPEGAILQDDLTAIEFLEHVKSTQLNWVVPGNARPESTPGANHNVSNTVVVGEDEWEKVETYLWENRKFFTGVSLLPKMADKLYQHAPREVVTTPADLEKWNHLATHYVPVPWETMVEDSDGTNLSGEAACAGGACEVSL